MKPFLFTGLFFGAFLRPVYVSGDMSSLGGLVALPPASSSSLPHNFSCGENAGERNRRWVLEAPMTGEG
ncbi:hypothetical protein DY000_02038588 [Brassica cretica]|uniref:Secreted protein n=1 Tax=Brassica cretica TaxID=69181 RepID=A0ABQ7B8W7_BRACR|nr:hypothetical protein DY000_02038588 [Brassica cretica]